MYTSENNWYQWQYGDEPLFGRQTSNLPFNTFYGKSNTPIGSFKEELQKAAKSTLDHYPGLKPCIFFSASGVIATGLVACLIILFAHTWYAIASLWS